MPEPIAVSFHRWPWSVDIEEESVPAVEEGIVFPFFGSPVVSVMNNVQVLLAARYEKFVPLGPSFSNGTEVYEMPHGILSQNDSSQGQGEVMLLTSGKTWNLEIQAKGAKSRTKDDSKTQSELACMILSWSQFFDDLMDNKPGRRVKTGKIPWDIVLEFLKTQRNDLQQPRLSLIVRIAEALHTNLPRTVSGMRRILLRERKMQRISSICETDVRCLQWYVRQPGNTMAEKGGSRQELLAVIRQQSFDVLENRVLKDFLHRCSAESLRYIYSEIDINPQFEDSKRAQDVRRFREICASSFKHPDFDSVPKARPGVRPNYVLQNDLRYRSVWDWYCRLLRREEEEDQFWDWQPRTWTDIVRLLMNLAIVYLTRETPPLNGIHIRQLLRSSLQVTREQLLGSRTRGGSEPGPFIIERITNGAPCSVAILEVVHSNDAHEHILAQNLGRTGGHLYLVIRPLDDSLNKNHVLIIWGINTAGTDQEISWEDISESAESGLKFHRNVLAADRILNLPLLNGLVVANALHADTADSVCVESKAPVAIMPSDPRQWYQNIDYLAILLYDQLERLL